jgi:nicotinamidase-related amidase
MSNVTASGETFDHTKTGLIVFDLLENARDKIVERGILEPVLRLVEGCRKLEVPIFFTRPMHRPDGSDFAKCLPEMGRDHRYYTPDRPRVSAPTNNAAGTPGSYPLSEFNVSPEDYDITKHRWSAFFETALELSLRTRGIETLLFVGGTTHIGVASSVYDARDLDFQVVVVRDGCHGEAEELACLLDLIFPQVGFVRTVDQVLGALK